MGCAPTWLWQRIKPEDGGPALSQSVGRRVAVSGLTLFILSAANCSHGGQSQNYCWQIHGFVSAPFEETLLKDLIFAATIFFASRTAVPPCQRRRPSPQPRLRLVLLGFVQHYLRVLAQGDGQGMILPGCEPCSMSAEFKKCWLTLLQS